MSENDVMVLADHSNFATTHEFYLAVADDLMDRARLASANSVDQKLLQICCSSDILNTIKKAGNYNSLPANNLTSGQGRNWTADTRIFSPALAFVSACGTKVNNGKIMTYETDGKPN